MSERDQQRPEERFAQLVTAASALSSARRWEASARAWLDAARFAVDAGSLHSARAALDAAGEAWRRDDRLEEAESALKFMLSLKPTAEETALAKIRLASMSGERCMAEAGLSLCRDLGGSVALRAMVIDTEIGLLWQLGRKEEVRARIGELSRSGDSGGALGLAIRFRQAQISRLDGEFALAEQLLRALLAEMRGQEGSDAGLAAMRSELAENDLLRGEPIEALEGYRLARELHETSGRLGLAYGAEGGRVRAAVAAGVDILDQDLERGLAYATDRGLRALAIELRLALGVLLAHRGSEEGEAVLSATLSAAMACKMRFTAGRARLERALRCKISPESLQGELRQAILELEGHVPLHRQALALLGRLSDVPFGES